MSVLHEAFETWLVDGARGDPARDVAIHASACPECMVLANARDALAQLDTTSASMPSAPFSDRGGQERPSWLPRAAASAIAVSLAAVMGVAASWILIRTAPSDQVHAPTQSPREAVLGGRGDPVPSVSRTQRPVPSTSPSPRPTTTVTPGEAPATTDVSTIGGPPPAGIGQPPPPPPTPPLAPGPTATPAPTTPSPAATPSPSPSPTPTPTVASPTPAPSPSASCEDPCLPVPSP